MPSSFGKREDQGMSFVPKHRRLVGCLFRKINRLAIAFRMYQTLQSSSPDGSAGRLMLWVGLFASFTYLVLSAWAQIVFGDRYLWMSDVRLVSIAERSEEHTSELQSLMRISYAVFCLKKKTQKNILNVHACQL